MKDQILKYKTNEICIVLSMGLIFLGLFIFFTAAHPMYIYDTDDWTYISFSRNVWPSISEWNPTRIMPETMMPLTAEIGVRLIMPFVQDYIAAMAIAFAFVTSLTATIYFGMYIWILKKQFKLDAIVSAFVGFIIVLFHFLPFNSGDKNQYMLHGENITCFFYYVIPGLINACIVLWAILKSGEKIEKAKSIKIGFLILIVYLCINSNMFQSIILISYIGSELLCRLYIKLKESRLRFIVFKEFVKENTIHLLIVIAWVLTIVIESRGMRAQSLSGEGGLNIGETIKCFENSIKLIKPEWILCVVIAFTVALIICLKDFYKITLNTEQKEYLGVILKLILSLFVTINYLILLCAKASPSYITRSNVMFSWMFYIVLIGVVSLGYVIKKVPGVVVLLPAIAYIFCFQTVIDKGVYVENSVAQNYSINMVKEVDDNIVFQVVEAEKRGETDVEVLIPVSTSNDWPVNIYYGGDRIATTLYRHGIVSKMMNIKLVPSERINEKFNLPNSAF